MHCVMIFSVHGVSSLHGRYRNSEEAAADLGGAVGGEWGEAGCGGRRRSDVCRHYSSPEIRCLKTSGKEERTEWPSSRK